ncbi:MAG: methyltransferase domain-containing protein [Steroidobacteraceae bacterium]
MNTASRPDGVSATDLPPTDLPGAIPTLNGTGFMLEALDEYALAFIDAAAHSPGEVLDIGCAYGVATLAALERGARVCASDMERAHLALLEQRVPTGQRARLRTQVGVLPDIDFPPGSFDAILASRVLHFLDGETLPRAVAAIARWLRPGGRVFLVADTPYMPSWSEIVPQYEDRKRAGARWPGYIADFRRYTAKRADGLGPQFLNTLDPDLLARECEAAGLVVERAGWFGMQRLGPVSSGREHAGCIARRPAASVV